MASLLANFAIVLVEPKYSENIGAAARSAMNMGISRLIVVRKEPPDQEKMLMMATHHAAGLIENLELYDNLADALTPFSRIIGTTARVGRQRRAATTTRTAMTQIIPYLKSNQVAVLFGPEHRGLTNDNLKYCDLTSTIPTEDFSSLNLGQAVAIHCYELYTALLDFLSGERRVYTPKQANSNEMEGMYHHLEEVLHKIEFLQNSGGRDDYWMRSIRQFLNRIELQAREVKIIHGFCRQFLKYEDS
ncbi:MAG: TrmJ/YjtD family RNA methyltransferase [Proteobacteria bacterium]|nr:TrmJ/YjtD family RNA methyltransferase [Pseudomonadota bacterium]MBU1716909.1 TrmJ/YjtD family RNA methyltransferase [Pseudomonadota bacterium]